MFLIKKLITAFILPPISLIALAAIGLWISRRFQRTGRWLAGLSLLSLAILSLPIVASALMRSLENRAPVQPQQLAKAQAIVILGGGTYHTPPEYATDTTSRHTLERIRYGVLLQKRSGLPILVSGGAPFGGRPEADSMKEVIERELGGKVRWLENHSRDTPENANLSAATLWASNVSRIVLVSHAWHLRRAIPLFEKQGLEVVAAPTAFTTFPEAPLMLLLPSAAALERSSMALHEWFGILAQTSF